MRGSKETEWNFEKKYFRVLPESPRSRTIPPLVYRIFHLLLSWVNLIRAYFEGCPGIGFHVYITRRALALVVLGRRTPGTGAMITMPMDSFRYFEFDFFWRFISPDGFRIRNWLDVSSPRNFLLRGVDAKMPERMILLNPDSNDLEETRSLFLSSEGTHLSRLEFRQEKISEFHGEAESFDMISSISVLEHLPIEDSRVALQKLWKLLRPKGHLLLSVPCSRVPYEEYIDFNEYGLMEADGSGYVFGQRFYSEALLQEEIYNVTGAPLRVQVYGEKTPGEFYRNRSDKLSSRPYPFWRESLLMSRRFMLYPSIDHLPGLGVIAMVFKKP